MLKRHDTRLVILVSAAGILAMLFASWSAQSRIRSWQREFAASSESPAYIAATLTLEHQRFLEAVTGYANALDGVTRDALAERLDIYWSRHAVFAVQGKRFLTSPKDFGIDGLPPASHTPALHDAASGLRESGERSLQEIELLLEELRPGDRQTLQAILSALLVLSRDIARLQVHAFEQERYLDQVQQSLSEKLKLRLWQAYVSIGLGIALMSLILAKYLRQKNRAALQLQLVNRDLLSEIAESDRLAGELERRATHDALSGLSNRFGFDDALQALLSTGRGRHGLCFIDLDMFKIVNDTGGHVAGDELIRRVADILSRRAPAKATVARFGGDEFLILVPDCEEESFERLVRDCCDSMNPLRFEYGGKSFDITGSFGAALFGAAEHSPESLMAIADTACYEAKRSGGARVHFHTDDTTLETRRADLGWVERIRQALDEDRFCLYHQSIVSLQSGTGTSPTSWEFLVRMIDTDGAILAPGRFLDVAERYALISRLDRWVIGKAFAWLSSNAQAIYPDHVNVNLSGRSIGDRGLLAFIEQVSVSSGIDPSRVCFEITETAIVGKDAREFLERLKELGFRLALDDFGSGFSSFGYLESLPVDYIKLDGLFVRDIDTNPTHREFVKAIGAVGKAMGKLTVAEYVQNEASERILTELGIDFAQGYHVARPAPTPDSLLHSIAV